MEENEELDSDFNAEDIPISDGFWNYMESYWHNNREFPQSTESQLAKKADLVSGKVPASQLPSYVDDILEFESFETLPNLGEKGKIYVIVSDYTQYRWSGSDYIQINSAEDLITTNTSQEVTGIKKFINKGNAVGDLNLQIWGKNGAKAGVYFYSEGMDTSQINFDGYFNFKNQDDEGYRNIKAAGFMKDGYNNGFILLAGGGHIPITEFVLNSDFNNQLSIVHKIDGTGGVNNGSTGRVNKSWFDYNWAGTGERGSTINFSGLDNEYATEIFGSYENNKFGFRTHQGDIGTWNEPRWIWHDNNFNPADYATTTQLNTAVTNGNTAFSWGNHASAGYAQALENASAIGFESGNPEQPYIYHNTDGHKSLATTDWVHSQDFTTPAFVEETIAQLTREFINPYSLIFATNKLITIIITDDFTQDHVDLDSELTPSQQITIINLASFDIDLIRNGNLIDNVLSKETTEYYTSAYPKFIRKGSYKNAEILD